MATRLFELEVDETTDDFHLAHAAMLWLDDLDFDLNGVQNNIYTQYVSAHFIDIEQDVDQKEWTVDDVMLP